jgi:hypothetical protein
MLKIETRIDPTEINGTAITGLPNDADQVIISAHWNINRFVVIDFHGRTVTVLADDLQRAIRNATNHD